jgi:hypothetical protein
VGHDGARRRCRIRRGRRHPLRSRRRRDEGGRRGRRPCRRRSGADRLLRGRHRRAADGLPARPRAHHGRNRDARDQRDPDRGSDGAVRRAAAPGRARGPPSRLLRVRGRGRGRARTEAGNGGTARWRRRSAVGTLESRWRSAPTRTSLHGRCGRWPR